MRIAVCCPGPSLLNHWPGRLGFDGVWSVNRALCVIDTDWLSAGDSPMFRGLAGFHRPRIGVLTMFDTAKIVREDPGWNHLEIRQWDDCDFINGQINKHSINWSVQAALCGAAESGASEIVLYGCDFGAGGQIADCTGYLGEDRGPERWKREKDDVAKTIAMLTEHGVTVTRIAP